MNSDLTTHNSRIPTICQCQGCSFPADRYCRLLPLPKYILLCDHCTVDLQWHGVVEALPDDDKIESSLIELPKQGPSSIIEEKTPVPGARIGANGHDNNPKVAQI